jgi:hypothetical protein
MSGGTCVCDLDAGVGQPDLRVLLSDRCQSYHNIYNHVYGSSDVKKWLVDLCLSAFSQMKETLIIKKSLSRKSATNAHEPLNEISIWSSKYFEMDGASSKLELSLV